jgi:hypothetical protein
MSVDAHPSVLLSVGIAALIVWRLVTRVRRMVGRQRLSRIRPWLTATLFPLLLAGLLVASTGRPTSALALVLGAALGAGLGVLGLRLTKFEVTPTGLFYTPNAHLGIALSVLFIGRIAYRFGHAYLAGDGFSTPPEDLTRSPLTLVIFATLAGYYIAYAVGLLLWKRRAGTVVPASTPTATAEGSPKAEP